LRDALHARAVIVSTCRSVHVHGFEDGQSTKFGHWSVPIYENSLTRWKFEATPHQGAWFTT